MSISKDIILNRINHYHLYFIVIVPIILLNLSPVYFTVDVMGQNQSQSHDDSFVIRKTAISVPGVPSPGHEDHQIVMALPTRDDGKIWSGKVSWISSEPIEVGFLIKHNTSITDTEHSKVEPLQINEDVFASTNLTGITPQATFGTFDFVVDNLVFHSTNNVKFTVTYGIDAVAKNITGTNST
jgi:hypothetical protein